MWRSLLKTDVSGAEGAVDIVWALSSTGVRAMGSWQLLFWSGPHEMDPME